MAAPSPLPLQDDAISGGSINLGQKPALAAPITGAHLVVVVSTCPFRVLAMTNLVLNFA